MDFYEVLLYYLTNPDDFFNVADEFFNELHGFNNDF